VKGRATGAAVDADDHRWMRRALTLARRGRGTTRPNPMVGAVVVRAGRVLGEGFHRRAGEPHAEIEALAALKEAGRSAAGATIYVNLEPCAHIGRTAPCVDALIAAGVARVVVGVRDPNPLVDGRGTARLRRAGIQVDVGCLEEESHELNRAFFTWVSRRRPLVTLKTASTLDGFIADGRRRSKAAPAWITGPAAREAGHHLRAQHDAILVGVGTVLADDPKLTVRLPRGAAVAAQPQRVVLDGRLRTPVAAAVLRPHGGPPTLIIGTTKAGAARAAALRRAGADVELLGARAGRLPVAAVLRVLARRGVQSLLVEGGAAVAGAFVSAGAVDRVVMFHAPLLLGGGLPAATGAGRGLGRALRLGAITTTAVGNDFMTRADVVGTPT
jgi:diaminohydroxyphosphoribosylaminopyrimidine deaminase / 5-amino-6-(5-phosphoribosylamino)uracil reductase